MHRSLDKFLELLDSQLETRFVFCIRFGVVNIYFFGHLDPTETMFHDSEIWLYTLSSTNNCTNQPGTKVQEKYHSWQAQCGRRSEWLKSNVPMNCWFSWMPQTRRIPNDVCEYNHLTQPTDTDGYSETHAKLFRRQMEMKLNDRS